MSKSLTKVVFMSPPTKRTGRLAAIDQKIKAAIPKAGGLGATKAELMKKAGVSYGTLPKFLADNKGKLVVIKDGRSLRYSWK